MIPIGVIGVCAWILYEIPGINIGAAAPVLLLAVLLIARNFGTGPALVGSACASLAFAYFFVGQVGVFVEDPNDWITTGTFALTALIVGELAARAEQRRINLEEGKQEIEQLYTQLTAAFERASASEAARRNEQLKATLLDALTHNLRTPLTAIKASVTALLGGSDRGALPIASQRELLHVIDEESDRLNLFIEGLTGTERTDHGHPSSLRTVSAEAIIRQTVARAATVARRHKVVIVVDPSTPELSVERAAIDEALYTLVDNASKYAPHNTTITIRAHPVAAGHARIAVEDEGPGIPPELREQVFEKFFRIPGRKSVDPRRTGIGLGLPIARRLVESQGGEIAIETSPSGRGTVAAITLPCVIVTVPSIDALAPQETVLPS